MSDRSGTLNPIPECGLWARYRWVAIAPVPYLVWVSIATIF